MAIAALAGLDLLATAVLLIDHESTLRYANPAAENLFELSSKTSLGRTITEIFQNGVLDAAIDYARANDCSYIEHDLRIGVLGHGRLQLSCTVSPVEFEQSDVALWGDADTAAPADSGEHTLDRDKPQGRGKIVAESLRRNTALLLEFRHIEQQMRIAREERLLDQSLANRELIRNLAHEIKNPLGGIRGAAQLLDHELERPALHEYTQVIMKEADRLQSLMDRLLTPHRLPQRTPLNIHEVLERVRSLILAEYPEDIVIRRDYDVSVPLLVGDKEQLIQVVLNIVRNAAQAMKGQGRIALRTRVARQVTLVRKRHKHALQLDISDSGPGIAEELRERIFYPLVSGRDGGSGLGLTLAQTFVAQHGGTITFESHRSGTTFTLLLPVDEA